MILTCQIISGKTLSELGEIDSIIRNKIESGKCPAWVPVNRCESWNSMARSELELYDILVSGYKIDNTYISNNILYITVKRHTIITSLQFKGFDNISKVEYKDNIFKFKYINEYKSSIKEKATYFGAGSLFSFIVVLFIILL